MHHRRNNEHVPVEKRIYSCCSSLTLTKRRRVAFPQCYSNCECVRRPYRISSASSRNDTDEETNPNPQLRPRVFFAFDSQRSMSWSTVLRRTIPLSGPVLHRLSKDLFREDNKRVLFWSRLKECTEMELERDFPFKKTFAVTVRL